MSVNAALWILHAKATSDPPQGHQNLTWPPKSKNPRMPTPAPPRSFSTWRPARSKDAAVVRRGHPPRPRRWRHRQLMMGNGTTPVTTTVTKLACTLACSESPAAVGHSKTVTEVAVRQWAPSCPALHRTMDRAFLPDPRKAGVERPAALGGFISDVG